MRKRIDWTEENKKTVFKEAARLIGTGQKFQISNLFKEAQKVLEQNIHRPLGNSQTTKLNKQFKAWSASTRIENGGQPVAVALDRAKDSHRPVTGIRAHIGRPIGSKNRRKPGRPAGKLFGSDKAVIRSMNTKERWQAAILVLESMVEMQTELDILLTF